MLIHWWHKEVLPWVIWYCYRKPTGPDFALFPLSRGIPRVDDLRVISGIIFVIRNGLRWTDAPPAYGPHKTIYNRCMRWRLLCVFSKIFAELITKQSCMPRMMITDKLRFYGAARTKMQMDFKHRQHKGLNNRAETSHLPTRR